MAHRLRLLTVVVFVLLSHFGYVHRSLWSAELSYYLPTGTKYSKHVPTPGKFLGFNIGDRHIQHHQLVSYLKAIASVSDRVTWQKYAETHGGRPLLMLTITSPANHNRWPQIKSRHLQLADPAKSQRLVLDDLPAVINMGYSVHGNEASAGNAAALVVYHLAAAEGEAIHKLLDQVVILVDPCLNPEGFDRFAHWVNTNRGRLANADPAHREHNESWPSGRTNYYWFDLNRDWLPLQHPESRGRLRQYHQVKPNVVLDFHEMGSNTTFFFQPGVPTRNHPLTPTKTFELTNRMAQYHAKALDGVGSLYFTEERFDDYYMGKGSTYPDLHGAVGILFEQGSARGHRQKTSNGLLTFSFAIRNQFLCSLSSLAATRDLRSKLLEHKREFYRESMKLAGEAKTKAYVFAAPHDPARLFEFAEVLRLHGIKSFQLSEDLRTAGRIYAKGHSLLVPTSQPEYRFLLALFERRTKFTENVFYDVSTWTLPLAFNLQYNELDRLPPAADWEKPWRHVFPTRRLEVNKKDLAYIVDCRGYYVARTLNRLLQADAVVKVSRRPFEVKLADGIRKYGRGTLLVPLGIQAEKTAEIRRILRQSARQDGTDIQAVTSGLTPTGIDLGSSYMAVLRKPKVLLVVGSGVRAYEAGEVWHLLDHRFGIPLTLVESRRLGSLRLADFTSIILVSGSYKEIDQKSQTSLQAWLSTGGNLIAIGSAASYVKDAKLAPLELAPGTAFPPQIVRRTYAGSKERAALKLISGAIFATMVDTTHPLGYGYVADKADQPWATLPVFRNNRVILRKSSSPERSPAIYTSRPLLSGYVSAQNLARLSSSASIAVHRAGRGVVLVYAENPNFLAFWYGTNRLFLNGIFFGHTIAK